MTPTLEALGIDGLSVNEKVELIARIWESLPPGAVAELREDHLADLKMRLARPAAINEALDRNRAVAHAINDEALRDPQSPYRRRYVGIADGQVVIVTENLGELENRLMDIDTDPWNKVCFVAGVTPTGTDVPRMLR
jgi:hypothetical protein